MVDNDQNTVGHLAAKNDHLKCIQYLIELGFPVDLVRNSNGRNVTHVCCVFGSVRTLHWLFENGTNIKILDGKAPWRVTAIMYCLTSFNVFLL